MLNTPNDIFVDGFRKNRLRVLATSIGSETPIRMDHMFVLRSSLMRAKVGVEHIKIKYDILVIDDDKVHI